MLTRKNFETANYAGIDLFKLIMAFMVVAIHTQPFYGNEKAFDVFSSFSRYAVPFFFLSSGFFVGRKMETVQSLAEKRGILREYALKILRLYLLWSLIYLPLAVYSYIHDSIPFFKAIMLYIRGLFLIGEHYNSWQLWYLLSLLFAIELLWLLIRLKASAPVIAIVSTLMLVLSTCFSELVHSQPSGLLLLLRDLVSLSIANGKILRGLFYFPIGTLLSRRIPSIYPAAILLCISYATARFLSGELWLLSDLIFALSDIALFSLVLQLDFDASPLWALARRLSTYIYFVHMLVFSFICIVLLNDDNRQGMEVFLMTAALSLLIAIIYDLFKSRKKHTV